MTSCIEQVKVTPLSDYNRPTLAEHAGDLLRTGGGPPGVLFYKRFVFYFIFLKFIFEHKPLFFQIRIKNSLGVHPLSFTNFLLVSE